MKFEYVPIGKIDVSLFNVRKSHLDQGIEELARSIEEIGVQQPVVVFKKADGRYELIIGQRRYLACRRLEDEARIPALITTVMDRTEALVKSFSENIQRVELDYRDKQQVAVELMGRLKSVTAVAKRLGVSPQTVKRYLGYAAVPEKIKNMVDGGRIHATTAIEIVQNVEDESKALEVAEKINELPRSEDRSYFINIAGQGEKSSKEAFRLAKRRSGMKKITIHVTEKIYDAVIRASKKYDMEKERVASEAVEEWLSKKGFIE